jgi:hypothetical protein
MKTASTLRLDGQSPSRNTDTESRNQRMGATLPLRPSPDVHYTRAGCDQGTSVFCACNDYELISDRNLGNKNDARRLRDGEN